MKRSLYEMAGLTISCISVLLLHSCSDSGGNKAATSDSTATRSIPKMGAKERLAVNNILEQSNDLVSLRILGKVRTRTETDYILSGDRKNSTDSRIDSFDERGAMAGYRAYEISNGKATWTRDSVVFDAKHNAVAEYKCEDGGQFKLTTTTTYDSRGNLTILTLFDKNEKPYRIDSYKYDDKDNLIELDLGNKMLNDNKWTYRYDENGFVKEGASYDTAGKLTGKQTRKYDDKGNFLHGVYYNLDGSIDSRDSGRYDDRGHSRAIISYNKDGSIRYKYVVRKDNKDKGRVTEMVAYKGDDSIDEGTTTFYTYEFDATGNVVKKTKFKMKAGKKVATEMTESMYTYY